MATETVTKMGIGTRFWGTVVTHWTILRGLWKLLELRPGKASDCSEHNELLFCGKLEDNAERSTDDGGKVCDVSEESRKVP